MAPSPTKKPKTTAAAKKHVFIQSLPKRVFTSTTACRLPSSNASSTAKRTRHTPRGDASKCIGSVRLGQDGKSLYIATPKRKRDAHYKGSPTSGRGTHIVALWKKIYNARTGKPFKVDELAPSLLASLS